MSDFKNYLEKTREIGRVVSITHSIIMVSGLPNLKPKEMIITEDEEKGMTYGLNENLAEVFMFDIEKLKIGKRVARTNEIFKIPVSQNLLGRIVNPLCRPIDGLGPIGGEKIFLSIEREAPPISQRAKIKQFLETGVTIVDLLIPIGYGQRELVIGDGKTGKTTFLLQTILSQVKKEVVCIYVSIGKESTHVKRVEEYLKETGVFKNTILLVAAPNSPATIIYLAPYSGMTIAEYFRQKGKKVLIILDDLTTHAKIYREISLLLKRAPGRTVYPGDIFHIQAALMERAGNIINKEGEIVSITALPVAETLENDISGYIQTNLMAMTDGHIFFDIEEFKKGKRPAVNAFLSVSRVGNQTKGLLDQELANLVRKKLAEYQKALEIARFGVELPEETRKIIDFGEKLGILFNQDPKTVLSRGFQLFLFGLLLSGFWDGRSPQIMTVTVKEMLEYYKESFFSKIETEIEKIKNIEDIISFSRKIGSEINKMFYGHIKEN